jgi:hypothetical protein
VPGEVAIEFGITGPYAILIGGATATLEALWYAGRLLAQRAATRVLVVAVEAFQGCEDLYGRARRVVRGPLVEAAACALVVPGRWRLSPTGAGEEDPWVRRTRRRAGETFACEPLVALALARQAGKLPGSLTGRWRGREAALALAAADSKG